MPSYQINHRGRSALVRNMVEFDLLDLADELGKKIAEGPEPRGEYPTPSFRLFNNETSSLKFIRPSEG